MREEKILSMWDTMDWLEDDILREFRDWLVGGATFQWKYYRSKLDGSLILERW